MSTEPALIRASSTANVERKPGELPQALKAVRAHCKGCCGAAKEVALCTVTHCPLWPYRFGSRTRARKIVAQERTLGPVEGRWWAEKLEDYTGQKHYQSEQRARERERGG